MDSQFTCQQCFKFFSPGPKQEKVYVGRTLCMMCRKAAGQKNFTQDEEMALFWEEKMARREMALDAE